MNETNDIVGTFLLLLYKFMLEMHLIQPAFVYSAFEAFTKKQRKNAPFFASVFIQARI